LRQFEEEGHANHTDRRLQPKRFLQQFGEPEEIEIGLASGSCPANFDLGAFYDVFEQTMDTEKLWQQPKKLSSPRLMAMRNPVASSW